MVHFNLIPDLDGLYHDDTFTFGREVIEIQYHPRRKRDLSIVDLFGTTSPPEAHFIDRLARDV